MGEREILQPLQCKALCCIFLHKSLNSSSRPLGLIYFIFCYFLYSIFASTLKVRLQGTAVIVWLPKLI